MNVGDYVQMYVYAGTRYTVTGRIDKADLMFGRIEKCGQKTMTVLWETGCRNRVRRGKDNPAKLITDPEVLKAAKQAMKGTKR